MKRSSAILKSFVVLGMLTFGLVAGVSAQGSIIIRRPGHPGPLTPHPTPITDCTPSPSGLVAWWPAEGSANDIVGSNNGTLVGGATFAAGEVDQAFSFDGTSGYVSIPDSPSLDSFTSSITIETWFKVNQTNANADWKGIVTKGNSSWRLMATTFNNTVYFGLDGVSPSRDLYGTRNVNDGQWHHVAAVYDGTNMFLYVDGTLDVSQPATGLIAQNNSPVCLGATDGAYELSCSCIELGYFLNGLVDEASIYNRALSSNEIAAIYSAGSGGKCLPTPPAVPVISSFAPASGTNGTVVTIRGTNFSATAALNIVYFGAVRAGVLSANPTTLVVTVPVGATYAPVTVTVNELTAYAGVPFLPTFNGGGAGGSLSLAPRLDLPASDGPEFVALADLDGDGRPDLLVCSSSRVSIYQNINTNGMVTAASFAPPVDLTLPGGLDAMTVADVDGDGKLDIVLLNRNLNQVMILKNLSAPGIITTNSFAAPVAFSTGSDPRGLAVRDLDGDGKPELIVANWGDNTICVFHNIGQPGSISTDSFAPAAVFAAGANPQSLAVADLDGDGQPDIVTANNNYGTDNSVSILRNTSSPGNISLAPRVDLAGLPTSYCVVIGDLDGDGKPDLAVSSFINGQAVSVYRNTSTPGSITTNSFAPHVDFDAGGWGNAVAIGDLDGDGKPDLAVVTQLPDHLSIFKNTSTPGSFTTNSLAPRIDYPAGWNPNGVAIGDLDGDGRPDIAFAVSYAATLSIYQNQTPLNGPPVITLQPTNQTAAEGASVVLSVTAVGAAPLSYQWSFNGTNISGATSATLTLTNLHPNQSGNYAVTITSPYGSVTSSNASVTVMARNILIYRYSGAEKITTAGQSLGYAFSGQLFFTPDNTNGTFVGWSTIKGKKQYWINPLPEYLWITIPGADKQTFTVVGQAGQAIDASGYPNIWADLYKGQNTMLAIGSKKYFSFPNTFANDATHVYPDSQTGKMVLDESASTFTFMAQGTQTANNTGQTMTDLVNVLTKSLESQGYQKQ